MNSDLMPSEPSNSTMSIDEASTNATTEKPTSSGNANPSVTSSETAQDENLVNRQQPIPPPSEPMQYRAIGLVRGRYVASEEQFTQGFLVTPDAAELDAVLLGRIMSLVKNHLDLEQEHLWVVYPRTRQENDKLHLQIVGVWEPEKLAKALTDVENQDSKASLDESKDDLKITTNSSDSLTPSSEIPDGGFSVRGEVVYQSHEGDSLVIKIKQAPRKNDDKPKYFKLKLKGNLNIKAVGKFWDLQVKREADLLTIETAEAIADLPKKRRPSFRGGPGGGGGGGRRPFNRGGAGASGGSKKPFRKPTNGETPRPIKKGGDASATTPRPAAPNPSRPTPKPIKRPKPEE